jgi:hypothetical protein
MRNFVNKVDTSCKSNVTVGGYVSELPKNDKNKFEINNLLPETKHTRERKHTGYKPQNCYKGKR